MSTVHACFNNEYLIPVTHFYELTILSLHDFSTNNICCHVLFCESLTRSSIKVSLCVSSGFFFPSSLHLKGYLFLNSFFLHFCFSTDLSDSISFVFTNSVFSVVGGHNFGFGFTIDSNGCVVECFSCDGVFEIKMFLWNVLLCYSSTKLRLGLHFKGLSFG